MVDLPLVLEPELFTSVLAEGGCAPPRPKELEGKPAVMAAAVVMAGVTVPPENESDGVLVAPSPPRPKEKLGVAEVVVVPAAGGFPKENPERVDAAEAGAIEAMGWVKPTAAGAVVLVPRPKLKLLVVVAGAAGVVELKPNPLPGALVPAGWPREKPTVVLPVPKPWEPCWGWVVA